MASLKETITAAVNTINDLANRFSVIADEFQLWGTSSGFVTIHDPSGEGHSVPGLQLMRGLYNNVYSIIMYVDKDIGDDTSGSGTASAPFKTISKALSKLAYIVPAYSIIRLMKTGLHTFPAQMLILLNGANLRIEGKKADGSYVDPAPVLKVQGSDFTTSNWLIVESKATFVNIDLQLAAFTKIPIVVGIGGHLVLTDSNLSLTTSFGEDEVITLHSTSKLDIQKTSLRDTYPKMTGLAGKRFVRTVSMNRIYLITVDFDTWLKGFTLARGSKLILDEACYFANLGGGGAIVEFEPTTNHDSRGNETGWGQFSTGARP